MAASEQNRLPLQERRKGCVGCWGALSCFRAKKGERRIVPASRIPEGTGAAAESNGPQAAAATNQATSLLAPPSSPASLSHSAVPSTVQSPSCLLSLSANSPRDPHSTMFATGPYAHETQLVSPPVFSTFTTEPSTAPLTPPPELAHLTTPSSPDVPYARFLISADDLKNTARTNYVYANDLQAAYSLYPDSPASSLRSPVSRTSGCHLSLPFPEREFPSHWDPLVSPRTGKCSRSDSSNPLTPDTSTTPKASEGSNFFCPATFARYYLDHDAPFSHAGGRLSVSKDSDVYSASGNSQLHRQARSTVSKQDMEELEAYRASFGFSADEVVTTSQYVEITDVMGDSFTMRATPTSEGAFEQASQSEGQRSPGQEASFVREKSCVSESDVRCDVQESPNSYKDQTPKIDLGSASGASTPRNGGNRTDGEDVFPKLSSLRTSRRYHVDLCNSDAEIDYRRGRRSLREGRGDLAWHD